MTRTKLLQQSFPYSYGVATFFKWFGTLRISHGFDYPYNLFVKTSARQRLHDNGFQNGLLVVIQKFHQDVVNLLHPKL